MKAKKYEKSDIAHYYVFKSYFTDYDDALDFCMNHKPIIPFEFIVKTKWYIDFT